jgi:hypothetical protein
VAASLYSNRLAATLAPALPARAVTAAKGSVGGAIIAAHQLSKLGLNQTSEGLAHTATNAFLFSLSGGCLVAGGVALAGAVMAALLLPARPQPSHQLSDGAMQEREISLTATEPVLARQAANRT